MDILVEATLFGFAWLHNTHERLQGRDWTAFVQQTRMPLSMRWRFDLALEQTAAEAAKGFPKFLNMAAVFVAATLEAAIRDFARHWLRDHRPSWDQEAVRRIELPAVGFSVMKHSERSDAILVQLELALRVSGSGKLARPGIESLQRLLGALGVAPKVPEKVTQGINELVAVRNQLLHHAGQVDSRFAELCPQLYQKQRRTIRVTDDMLARYFDSSRAYLELIRDHASSIGMIEAG